MTKLEEGKMPNLPQGIETLIQITIALIGAYVTALWFSLVVWTFRDVQKRTRDIIVQVLATLLVLLFNLPGLLLYTVLRPPETLAEAYARSLEEESLMQDLEERQACPNCKHLVESDFVVCPSCMTQLRSVCSSCNRLLHLGWRACPYCGVELQ
jgi:RNA polymerase subunit RPABC4/transcription elongation factor Spt4